MLDLIIKEARLLDETPIEIGIKAGKIQELAPKITIPSARTYSACGHMVSAGWIDSHVHCYEKMTLYYDVPDEIGIKKGVTTIIDAGTAGEKNIGAFHELAKKAKTNVFALMNISESGIVHQDELADLNKINEDKNLVRLAEYPAFILGLKARMSKTVIGVHDVAPLKMAKRLQKKAGNIPLMVHIGSAPPKLEAILALLEKGDIVTHCYNGKPNGILDAEEEIKPFVWQAYEKGVLFDIGHGTDSFNFEVGEKAIRSGLICSSISTDIYHHNRESGPVYDLATTLDKALSIGISLPEAIKMVTENPAQHFHLKNKGHLAIGMDADLTIFEQVEKEKILTDSNGNERRITHQIVPRAAIVAGTIYPIKEAMK